MSDLKIGSLFSGYGGLDMAVESVTGAKTAWVSDIDKGACKILAHRYPDIPNHGDLTQIDWSAIEPVDIITGGFPCQDLSHAGKGAGMTSESRSGLWSYMAEAINIIRPRLVVAENVRGLLSAEALRPVEPCTWCVGDDANLDMRALGAVLADLADIGYDASWYGLRAADIGACHGRWRCFVVAYPQVERRGLGIAAHKWATSREGDPLSNGSGVQHHPIALLKTPTSQLAINGGSQHPDKRREGGHGPTLADEIEHLLPTTTTMDAHASGGGYNGQTNVTLTDAVVRKPLDFGRYAAAIARWEAVIGRPAPSPTEPTGKGGTHRLSPRFTEWMMGLPDGWITDTPGLTRNEALKACGNGVVPQQAASGIRRLLPASEMAA